MKSERGQRTLPQIGYGYRCTNGCQCCQRGKTKIVKCFLVQKDGLTGIRAQSVSDEVVCPYIVFVFSITCTINSDFCTKHN
jgi:hypothetical protein